MDLLKRAWSTPRAWRYVAVGAVMFALGTGTVVAANIGITQIGSLTGGGQTNIAQVDANHQLAVADASANSSLNGINSKLGGTLGVSGSVSVANNPSAQPVWLDCFVSGSAGVDFAEQACTNLNGVGIYRVPTAKLLVIQDIGVSCYTGSALQLSRVYVTSQAGQLPIDFAARGPSGTYASTSVWTGSETTVLYEPEGSLVPIGFTLSGASAGSSDYCEVNIVGGLIAA